MPAQIPRRKRQASSSGSDPSAQPTGMSIPHNCTTLGPPLSPIMPSKSTGQSPRRKTTACLLSFRTLHPSTTVPSPCLILHLHPLLFQLRVHGDFCYKVLLRAVLPRRPIHRPLPLLLLLLLCYALLCCAVLCCAVPANRRRPYLLLQGVVVALPLALRLRRFEDQKKYSNKGQWEKGSKEMIKVLGGP